MQKKPPREAEPMNGLISRLDGAAQRMNAFLLALAIGLGVLDFTCLWAFAITDALPSATRLKADRAVVAKPPAPPHDTLASVSLSRPGDTATGF